MDYSERLMRAAIRDIPDGVYKRRDLHRRLSATIPTRRGAI